MIVKRNPFMTGGMMTVDTPAWHKAARKAAQKRAESLAERTLGHGHNAISRGKRIKWYQTWREYHTFDHPTVFTDHPVVFVKAETKATRRMRRNAKRIERQQKWR